MSRERLEEVRDMVIAMSVAEDRDDIDDLAEIMYIEHWRVRNDYDVRKY